MTSDRMKAKLVRISIEEGRTGLFYATSPELKGLLVAKPTIAELEADIPRAVTELYAVCGQRVFISGVVISEAAQSA